MEGSEEASLQKYEHGRCPFGGSDCTSIRHVPWDIKEAIFGTGLSQMPRIDGEGVASYLSGMPDDAGKSLR